MITDQVKAHYTRPHLETDIRTALASAGKSPEAVGVLDLAPLDEFHLGWLEATRAIAEALHLEHGMILADIGAGLGGPARYFAHAHGCEVIGIDLTPDYVRVGNTLTGWCGLEARVRLLEGNATALPLEDASVDRATLLHVGMNIADKAAVVLEARRVLKSGGLFAVYDVMRLRDGDLTFPLPWASSPGASFVETPDLYRRLLVDAGFTLERDENFTELTVRNAAALRRRAETDGPSALGLTIITGPGTEDRFANLGRALQQGLVAPVLMVARAA